MLNFSAPWIQALRNAAIDPTQLTDTWAMEFYNSGSIGMQMLAATALGRKLADCDPVLIQRIEESGESIAEAQARMDALGPVYTDVGGSAPAEPAAPTGPVPDSAKNVLANLDDGQAVTGPEFSQAMEDLRAVGMINSPEYVKISNAQQGIVDPEVIGSGDPQ